MTPQERDVLLPLLDKLREAKLPEKDAEADQLIRQAASQQPDAVYILAQTVLMQDYALHQAQEQIQQLQQSQPQQSSGGGFLGGLFGANRAMAPTGQAQPQPQPQPNRPWGQPNQQGAYAQAAPAQPAYAPQSTYGAPMMAAMQPGYGQPSFLRSAATTAAGIAGGALLFQGIEGLMGGGRGGMMGGGFGGNMMGAGGFGGMPQQDIVENTTVNNYYDQAAPDSDVAVQGGSDPGYVDQGTPDDQSIDNSGSDDGSFGI